jgi:hypothetical protein
MRKKGARVEFLLNITKCSQRARKWYEMEWIEFFGGIKLSYSHHPPPSNTQNIIMKRV